MTKFKSIENALEKFEEAALKHAAATEVGDYKTANKSYAIIAKAIAFLKEHDEIQKLEQFFDHSSDGVKNWSATYLLPVQEKNAILVLEEIAQKSGFQSLDAATTLIEWRKGNLKL